MQTAKFLPPCPLHFLQRDRLVNRLLSYENRKLVIIHGPAGQGKTTLVAGLVSSFGLPVVWYNIDREDENPSVFLSSLASALRSSAPGLPQLPLPESGNLEGSLGRNALRAWIRAAFAASQPCLIVFDDLNPDACSPIVVQLVQALIEETPPAVRLILLSRSRPQLKLADLRAKRGLAEISGDDLKFTDDEVLDLFGAVFGMHLAPQEAATINRKTEGWPVGLVLMHEYLASAPDDAGRTRLAASADTTFHSHIFDYLAQQVFSHLRDDLQQFLLKTAVADYLPEPLQRELWTLGAKPGCPPATDLMEELKNKNLFVNPLSTGANTVRYHPLFREFLRKKLHGTTRPERVRNLYSKASEWFGEKGDPVRAVDLLLESGQIREACRLIDRSAAGLIAQGQAGTLTRWRESVPQAERSRPWFLLSSALCCRFTDPRAALGLFEAAYKQFGTAVVHDRASGRMLSLCGLIEACFHGAGDFGRMAKAAALAQSILRAQRGERPGVRSRLLLAIGMAWFFLGRLGESRQALSEALDRFRKQSDPFYQITCAVYLIPCALYQGDFRLARESLARGFEAHASIPEDASSLAALFLTKAMTALFEGNFGEARESLERCKNMADHHALESISFLSLDIEGWLTMALGEYDTATRLLTRCLSKAEENNHPFFIASAAHLLAITAMFRGRLAEAKKLSDRALAIRSQSDSKLFHAVYLVVHGAIHLKLGKTAFAEKELRTALRMLQQAKALQEEANAHLMLALLYRKTERTNLFRKHLSTGFSIGRDLGFCYYAPLSCEELTELAQTAAEECICEDYCRRLAKGPAGAVPALTLQCLGGFRVFRGTKEIPEAEWKSKLGKTLLKMLVADEGSGFPRERAIEMLWPDTRSGKSRPMFNSLFHRLKKTLQPVVRPGRDIFCTSREGDMIALNSDTVRTDVRQFRASLEQARRLKSANRPSELLKEYEQSVAFYRGDFLPEDLYHDWATETRDRLRMEYLRVLEDAGELAESLGEKKKAQQFFEKIFLTDPCSDKACRWLMTSYVSQGRRSDAIRVYERCERALSTEMGTEPEEKTKKLYRAILAGPG